MIKLARGLDLPIDAVTQTFGIIARKGAGKTYTGTKMAEEMLQAKAQIVALDPVGVWYGLRLGTDGKSKGLPIPLLGGDQGDIPLEHTAGKLVADMIMDTGTSAVLDVSLFRKAQRKEFVADFAEQLFQRAKRERIPLHLFLEEAQVFAPQRPGPGEQRMLGAIEDIVRLGRNYGLGASLISQRPQSVNKEVLNQVEALLVMQVNGAHERKAIQEWIVHQDIDVGEMMKELPSLEVGEGYLWSPQWLKMLKKVKINKKKTYDSSSTPKVGQVRTKPKKLMEVDLGALQDAMAATIEKTKANDPKELQKQLVVALRTITELEYRLENQEPKIKEVEVSIFKDNELSDLTDLTDDVRLFLASIERSKAEFEANLSTTQLFFNDAKDHLEPLLKKLDAIKNMSDNGHVIGHIPPGTTIKKPSDLNKYIDDKSIQSKEGKPISGPQLKILNALASLSSMGITQPKKQVVGIFAGYKPSGTFDQYLSRLRTAGIINYPSSGCVALTITGIGHSPSQPELLTLNDLHKAWFEKLSGPQNKIVKVLIDLYPNFISKTELAEATGYRPSGSFDQYLSRTRKLGILSYPESGHVVATDLLFPEGL